MATVVRNRGLFTALRYRGREGMWTWLLHRVTGLGILFFLVVHVIDTAIVVYSPSLYDSALALYKHALFRIAEVVIFFAVLFHAVNGVRIVVQDFRPYVMQRQRQLAWVAAILTAVVMIPVTWIMIAPLFGWADEPGTRRHIERCLERPEAPACQDAHESGGAP